MLTYVDNFLNKITMYRLVLYYLVGLLLVSLGFGFLGILPYSPEALLFSTFFITLACLVSNFIFAKAFRVTPNSESVYITALILALIITPITSIDYTGLGFIIFASAWAMGSKYIFAIGKKHIFNPAAFGIALSALVIGQSATWWVAGNLALLPFVVIGGLLIVRKIHRFDLVWSFTLVSFITIALTSSSQSYLTPIVQTLLHSSFFFLAFVMLTEPLTMPPSRVLRILYGAVVGFLFAPNIHIGSYYFTPEIALLIGNIFVYFVSPKGRFILTLLEKKKIGADLYEFIFASDQAFSFRPGQYLEWTLGHRFADNRGNRRYFTVASSPTEDEVRLGVKFYEPASTYKRALGLMKVNDTISVSHLAGDFVLPKDKKKKLVFIAGGIGVTPFRSMVQYLVDKKDSRTATLFYSNKTLDEVVYKDVFDQAEREIGFKTVYALTNNPTQVPGMYNRPINAALIVSEVPDYKERVFYISGPRGMVQAFKKTLKGLGVPWWKIKTDYFPGFA
ncbi:MAG: RnfABCDGE type electron transport complex subunit D [Candidatus Pacebacteria bacterium]|nr:RnfABCDGE type electron transport complex subunit D [Candidatus Paceibacterota bacterium]